MVVIRPKWFLRDAVQQRPTYFIGYDSADPTDPHDHGLKSVVGGVSGVQSP